MSIYKFLVMLLCFWVVKPVAAAEWRECEKAKLRQLNLERAAQGDNSGHSSGKRHARSRHPDKARADASQLDEWLWKNCRNYANELRTLEQDRM
jgi:hypothetical protein